MKEIIKIENVSKSYLKEKNIIKDCSFSVYEGEFLTLLGSSGCGKTTMLRMISGLETVSDGKIYIDGIDTTNVSASKRPVNTIFQNFALFPHMTVEENVRYGLKIKRVPKDEIKKRVEEMLELVSLNGYEKRKPSELSGGEQQRVAIARGLINKPKVLLLDEPLSSLDLKLKKQMQLGLKRLQKKLGITFVYVTHSQDEALTMSDRIIIFKDGKIIQQGKPKEIYHNPNSVYVADFIGDSNIFEGTVTNKSEKYITISLNENDSIKVLNTNFEINDKVIIVVRPEGIKVENKDANYNLEVKVKDSIYNGDFTRLIVSYNKKEIKVNVDTDKEYSKGDIVYLKFEQEFITLLGEENEK